MLDRTGLRWISMAALWLLPALAPARSFQPDSRAFLQACTASPCDTVDRSGFDDVISQIGSGIAGRFAGPAHTTGPWGIEIAYAVGLVELDRSRPVWQGDAATGRPPVFRDPGPVLTTGQLQVRKGLPAGFQIGGLLTQVFDSRLWGLGLELAWAFLEGLDRVPDLAIHLQAGTLLGADDLLLLDAAGALILSKSLPVAGLFRLAPFGGYQFLYTMGSTHLTAAPGPGETRLTYYSLEPRHLFAHRLVAGLQAAASFVTAGFEMTLDVPTWRRTYALRIGFLF